MEIRQSLEANFLTCRICQQTFHEPKVLECLHSFCQACVDGLVGKERESQAERERSTSSYYTPSRRKWSRELRYNNYSSNYSTNDYSSYSNTSRELRIKCPVCEKTSTVPRGGASAFPDDVLSAKLATMVGKLPNYPVCDVCTPDSILSAPSMPAGIPEQPRAERLGRPGGEGASASSSDADDEAASVISNGLAVESDVGENGGPSARHVMRNGRLKSRRPRRTKALNGRNSVDPMQSGADDTPKRATSACLDCAKRLCDYCEDMHSSMPVTTEHILIKVEQMENMKCPRHPRELRRFYCRTCECCICLVCTFDVADPKSMELGHSDHNVLSMRQAVEAYQEQIDADTNEAQINVEKLERILDGMKICEAHANSVVHSVDAAAERLIRQIREQQALLKEEISSRVGLDTEELPLKCQSLNDAIEGWYRLTKDETFSQRLDLMNPIEALDAALPLIDQLKESLEVTGQQAEPSPKWQQFYDLIQCPPKSTEQDTLMVPRATSNASSDCETSSVTSQSSGRRSALKKKRVAFKLDYEDPPDLSFWADRIGSYYPGPEIHFGRLMLPEEVAREEEEARKSRAQEKGLQVDVRPERRHSAIQVNFFEAHQSAVGTQTENSPMAQKTDAGTQYQSSDVNPPIAFFRGGKQIVVQK